MIDLSGESGDRIADWIEVLASCNSGRPLSTQKIQELSSSLANVGDNLTISAWRILSKRSGQLKDSYPFQIEDEYIVTRKDVTNSAYMKFLFLSSGVVTRIDGVSWSVDRSSRAFEDVAEKALRNFFGDNTNTLNFGFPSRQGRPAEFSEAIKWLSEKAKVRLGSAYRPPRRKDGGVDIFVWKSFSDLRPGIPIMLAQCTISDDFINKIGDVDIRLWSTWLSTDIEPLVALCIPGVVTKEEVWNEITTRGVLLDRLRLVEVCADSVENLDNDSSEYLNKIFQQVSAALK